MEIGATGTYVLLADVVASVREYAQSLDDPHSGGVIHELATWLGGGQRWADDSVFVENQERKAYPTAAPMRERVSPKRMFA